MEKPSVRTERVFEGTEGRTPQWIRLTSTATYCCRVRRCHAANNPKPPANNAKVPGTGTLFEVLFVGVPVYVGVSVYVVTVVLACTPAVDEVVFGFR